MATSLSKLPPNGEGGMIRGETLALSAGAQKNSKVL